MSPKHVGVIDVIVLFSRFSQKNRRARYSADRHPEACFRRDTDTDVNNLDLANGFEISPAHWILPTPSWCPSHQSRCLRQVRWRCFSVLDAGHHFVRGGLATVVRAWSDDYQLPLAPPPEELPPLKPELDELELLQLEAPELESSESWGVA